MERPHLRLRRRRVKTLRNQSTETAALIILEYIYDRALAGEKPPTAHWIQQHATKLRTTQLSRVQETLGYLEERGWVERAESTGGTSYRVTDSGRQFWTRAGKEALEGFMWLYSNRSGHR
jgi:CTP-dependent riboflavin kinase